MKVLNLFKKKKPPIDESLYDWNFQYIKGGFVPSRKLRKTKPIYMLLWFGGFKFSFRKLYKTYPEQPNNAEYSTTLQFDPETLNEFIKR